MIVNRLRLKNWRNFKNAEVSLRERAYIIGPNASGKSNLLDVLRFLRDIAKPEGGGLQKAVKDRGGLGKLRCLLARRDPIVSIEVELSDWVDTDPLWRYVLEFAGEGRGRQRLLIRKERVEDLRTGTVLLDRPDAADKNDMDRLTQTHLEQINANREFRTVADFFASIVYLHMVPQLLKFADQLGGYRLENDPFGQAFLERIAQTPEKTRASRLAKIEAALKICVPNMRDLKFVRDKANGTPHLEALYEHWRPDAGRQREDQFSDGTLRLLALLWGLLEGDSVLLMEEPELSLNEDIVRRIHRLIWDTQRQAKHRRQIFITTHSEALLEDESLDFREVVRLEPSSNGTRITPPSEMEIGLIKAGYSVAETMRPKIRPARVEQLSLQ